MKSAPTVRPTVFTAPRTSRRATGVSSVLCRIQPGMNLLLIQKRVRAPLDANRRVGPVAGSHDGGVRKREQHVSNGTEQLLHVAADQIRTADRSGKQRVAHEQLAIARPGRSDRQTDTAGTMSRRLENVDYGIAKSQRLAGTIELVDRRRRLDVEAEH